MKSIEQETQVRLPEEDELGASNRKYSVELSDYALLVLLFVAIGLMLLHG